MSIYINNFYGIDDLQLGKELYVCSMDAVQEPAYETLIDVRAMRRLSRILKFGIYAAQHVLNESGITPDGIITGTGLGCLSDTYAFLQNMIQREEHLLTPTAFIQSTHNTLSGTLGIQLKNHGYNMTWSQREFSFYCALEDAINKIKDDHGQNYLVVGADEMPDPIASILDQMDQCDDVEWSEGAAAFVISNIKTAESLDISEIKIIDTNSINSEELNSITENKTLLINSNNSIRNLEINSQLIDLSVVKAKTFVDDAIALNLACKILKDDESGIDKVICLSGNANRTGIIHITKS